MMLEVCIRMRWQVASVIPYISYLFGIILADSGYPER